MLSQVQVIIDEITKENEAEQKKAEASFGDIQIQKGAFILRIIYL